jgi:hypothetical protein
MRATELIVVLMSAAVAGGAVPIALRLRAALGKNRAAAATFAAPAALLAAPAAWLTVSGQPAAAAPLFALALACLAAAAVFAPTAATRFTSFERAFWAYVERVD